MMSIKESRKAAGLTQKQMSEVFDIPQRTIEDWEAGKRTPPAYVEKLIIKELERNRKMRNVTNEYGVEINFDVAVSLMDDEIREDVHSDLAPCTEQEFFDAYCKKHEAKYGEEFELAKRNPCY